MVYEQWGGGARGRIKKMCGKGEIGNVRKEIRCEEGEVDERRGRGVSKMRK